MRVGIIGTGASATLHARACEAIGFTVRACTDVNEEVGRKFAATHGAGQRRRRKASGPRIAARAVPGDGAPYGIRTRVLALRGPRPGPLDEGSNCLAAADLYGAATGWTTGPCPEARRTELASIWSPVAAGNGTSSHSAHLMRHCRP